MYVLATIWVLLSVKGSFGFLFRFLVSVGFGLYDKIPCLVLAGDLCSVCCVVGD